MSNLDVFLIDILTSKDSNVGTLKNISNTLVWVLAIDSISTKSTYWAP